MRDVRIGLLMLPWLIGLGGCAARAPTPLQPIASTPVHDPARLARAIRSRHLLEAAAHPSKHAAKVRLSRADKEQLFRSFTAERHEPGPDRLTECPGAAAACQGPRS